MIKEVKKEKKMTDEEQIMKENISFEELEASFMSLGTKFFHPGDMCRGFTLPRDT